MSHTDKVQSLGDCACGDLPLFSSVAQVDEVLHILHVRYFMRLGQSVVGIISIQISLAGTHWHTNFKESFKKKKVLQFCAQKIEEVGLGRGCQLLLTSVRVEVNSYYLWLITSKSPKYFSSLWSPDNALCTRFFKCPYFLSKIIYPL